MTTRNTRDRWGGVSQGLHWLIALLILVLLVLLIPMILYTRSNARAEVRS